jgi:hypothetical protein
MLSIELMLFPEKRDLHHPGEEREEGDLESKGENVTWVRNRNDHTLSSDTDHFAECQRHVVEMDVFEYLAGNNKIDGRIRERDLRDGTQHVRVEIGGNIKRGDRIVACAKFSGERPRPRTHLEN